MSKALEFATKKHEGQVRRASNMPYITHPIAVAELVEKHKVSKNIDYLKAASLLHDVIEDSDATAMELEINFGHMVASIVLELTNDPEKIKIFGKLEYQKKKMAAMSSYALVVKLSDRLHNISDSPTRKMKTDTANLLEFLEKNRVLTKTHERLITEIRKYLY